RLELHADPSNPKKDNKLIRSTSPLEFDEEGFARIQQVLDWSLANGLWVVIDLHSTPGKTEGRLFSDFQNWDAMIGLWKEIARRYGDHPAVIGYDLLNEPSAAREKRGETPPAAKEGWTPPAEWKNTPRDYDLLMRRATDAIRSVDLRTTIIVEGGWAGGMPISLRPQQPTGDPNTVYSCHMYQPQAFTGQGSPEHPEYKLGFRYPSDRLTNEDLLGMMQPIVDFQKRTGAPLYIGEFSTTRLSEPYGGTQWLKDVIDFFESHGWHWAYHSYKAAANWSLETGPDPKDPSLAPNGFVRLELMKQFWALNAKEPKPHK
ncbi:MAG: cellulase family glycosylhydrolase, partial [Candidatus Sumerlaeota bacterium]|nr:cellulase family glycosylhydrolase [Candidatus Sumerlaeota bacterium]